MGEAVMIELAKRSVGRQEAHEIVRTAAMQAHESGKHLRETLLANKEVSGYLNEEDVEKLVDPYRYIGTAVKQVEITVEKLREQYL
jgi:adenylosuccinate lyase